MKSLYDYWCLYSEEIIACNSLCSQIILSDLVMNYFKSFNQIVYNIIYLEQRAYIGGLLYFLKEHSFSNTDF